MRIAIPTTPIKIMTIHVMGIGSLTTVYAENPELANRLFSRRITATRT